MKLNTWYKNSYNSYYYIMKHKDGYLGAQYKNNEFVTIDLFDDETGGNIREEKNRLYDPVKEDNLYSEFIKYIFKYSWVFK